MNLSDRDIPSSSEYDMSNGHLMEKDVLPKSCPKLKTFLLATHSRLGNCAYQKSLSKPASHGTSKNPNKKNVSSFHSNPLDFREQTPKSTGFHHSSFKQTKLHQNICPLDLQTASSRSSTRVARCTYLATRGV